MTGRSVRGMTLLEVLCATTLSALLMVGLLGVIGGLAKTEKSLAGRSPTPDWHRRVVARLERDLGAAQELQILPDGFRLTGNMGSDSRTGISTWTGATVDYLVADSPLGAVLLRRETATTLGAEPRLETLACQITQLQVTSPQEIVASPQLPADSAPRLANFTAGGAKAIVTLLEGPPPSTFRLVLLDAEGNRVFDHLVTRP